MSGIEKIEQYIKSTRMSKVTSQKYQMSVMELLALYHATEADTSNAIALAFDYGKAKGYRAAKAEARR